MATPPKFKILTAYQLGKRMISFCCPFCRETFVSGSYFIAAKINGRNCLLGTEVTPPCSCKREIRIPAIFQFSSFAEMRIMEAELAIEKQDDDWLFFLRQDLVFKKLRL